jgi:hypothetical protein
MTLIDEYDKYFTCRHIEQDEEIKYFLFSSVKICTDTGPYLLSASALMS